MPPKLSSLIDRHERYYKRYEKPNFDKARRFYRGEFYSIKKADNAHVDRLLLCSKNLIYAIADTAVSSLLGPNPPGGLCSAEPRLRRSDVGSQRAHGVRVRREPDAASVGHCVDRRSAV